MERRDGKKKKGQENVGEQEQNHKASGWGRGKLGLDRKKMGGGQRRTMWKGWGRCDVGGQTGVETGQKFDMRCGRGETIFAHAIVDGGGQGKQATDFV